MKKSLILLTILVGFTQCKEKEKEVNNQTNEENVNAVSNNNVGQETTEASNGEIDAETALFDENSALHKKEDDSYIFRYNLKKGETYPFLMVVNTDQSMTMQGQTVKITSSRTVDFDYFVEEVNGNKFKLKATFKKFAESAKSPMGTMAYDTSSSKPSDPQIAQSWTIYKAITGQSFNMEIDNKGKVLSVNGLDKVVNSAMANLKPQFNSEEQKEIREMLSASLSNEAIKIQFEESLNIFPDKSMKVGEDWEESQNINQGPIKGQSKVVRTFKGINNGVATIGVKGSQNVGGTDTEKESGITAQMKNTSTIDGSVDLDLETGWLKKVKLTKKENVSNTYSKGEQKETESGSQTIITTVN